MIISVPGRGEYILDGDMVLQFMLCNSKLMLTVRLCLCWAMQSTDNTVLGYLFER